MNDHRRQFHQHISQNICRHDVVTLISHFILHIPVVNDISDHNLILVLRDSVYRHIFPGGVNGTGIQIRSHRIRGSEFQGKHTQNAASTAYVQNLCIRLYIFSDLADTQLGSFMHSGSERRTRINVNYHFSAVFRLYFLPGRNDQNVVYIELMEILFPVIHPVHVLGLRLFNQALAYIHIGGHVL